MADGSDTGAEFRWMAYPDGAKAFGMHVSAFRELCARLEWRRGKCEDGRPGIAVPLAELERRAEATDEAATQDGYPARMAEAMASLMSAKEGAESRAEAAAREMADLREQLARTEREREEARGALRTAEAAVREVAELREQLARAEGERDVVRDALRASEAAGAQASRQAQEARQQAAEAAHRAEEAAARAERAEAARRAVTEVPWWRRLLSPQG